MWFGNDFALPVNEVMYQVYMHVHYIICISHILMAYLLGRRRD